MNFLKKVEKCDAIIWLSCVISWTSSNLFENSDVMIRRRRRAAAAGPTQGRRRAAAQGNLSTKCHKVTANAMGSNNVVNGSIFVPMAQLLETASSIYMFKCLLHHIKSDLNLSKFDAIVFLENLSTISPYLCKFKLVKKWFNHFQETLNLVLQHINISLNS